MDKIKYLPLLLFLIASQTNAALIDRGSGLLYDNVLDITWLQDANYAKTSGYDSDGKMFKNNADQWVDDLVYYDTVRDIEYDDWRLPTNLENDLPFHFGWWVSGGTIDPNPTVGPHTELSYMYYINLGLNGYLNSSNINNFGIHGDHTFGGQTDVGLINNLQGGEYWLGFNMADVSNHYDKQPFTLNTNTGNHNVRSSDPLFVWAVRDGDVTPVPEPSILTLMFTGILGLGFASRRKSSNQYSCLVLA